MSNANVEHTPFIRHPHYYGPELLTFAVDGYLFQLPVRRLKESKYFQDMLDSEHLGTSVEGRSDDHPIELKGITSFEMESFAEILDARVFDKAVMREWRQLVAALHLATMWDFEDLRTRLIKDMSQMIDDSGVDPLDRIEVSMQCRVSDWLHPAYQVLCDRTEGVTTEEAKRLGMDRLAAIYRVRDRRHANAVDAAKAAAQNAQNAAQAAAQNAQNAQNARNLHPYSGVNSFFASVHTPAVFTTVTVVQTPTLNLIKAEDILSSLEGPLACTCT
ncbi:hypothetical protein FRC00_001490 [Tulasnella sp. 408]|nr:hypothetical protein FRC00_001490 [Tulasnella sp. 408]